MERINIALVGCGGIAGAHVNGYRDLHGRGLRIFNLKAVCDVSEENAESKAEIIEKFQGYKPTVYSSLDKMLSNESIDAVDICLPHNVHHTVACECLDRGLHIMIEKPLGITMRAARLIIQKAEKTGKVVAVAENYRRDPTERAKHWAAKRGLIGEPRMVIWMAATWGPKPWGWREDKFVAGGSWVFDGGVHWADLDRYQLGREAIEVFAVNHTFDKVKEGVKVTVDDMTMAIVRYEGNVYSQWLWTRAAPAKRMVTHTIYGSKGALNNEGLYLQREDGAVESKQMLNVINEMRNDLDSSELERLFPGGSTNTFAIELYDFYLALTEKRKPEVDAYDGYKDMAIPMGFYESAALNRPVTVRDVEELRVEEYQKEINERLGI
ncbi:MAG: hypothetical protein AYL33_005610 [Candidatus Bathyarchaeota archaeon B63]|nr:MAG: hypothetical protein AYL33_005610 [Candidatus Bathyarchaeota archaeon B63]